MWVVALVAILVGTVLQRLSGTGVGLVCAPVLALLLGSAPGVLVTNATTTVSGFLIMLSVRRFVDWRRAAVICLAAVPGAIAGALVVRALPAAWLQVVIGGVVLLGVLLTVATPRLPDVRSRFALATAGTVGGFLNTAAGVAAPAMVIYSRLSRWEQRSFAATLQPVFMTMGFLSVTSKTLLGAAPVTPPAWVLPAVVLTVLLGALLGGIAAARVRTEHARALALVLAGTGAAVTLVRGVLAL